MSFQMKPRPSEFAGDGFDAFQLVGEEMSDGARILAEREASRAALAEAENQQISLFDSDSETKSSGASS